jgi:hypothetical protein
LPDEILTIGNGAGETVFPAKEMGGRSAPFANLATFSQIVDLTTSFLCNLLRRIYLLAALAAATILSKRGSPRKSSQRGSKRSSPYDGPFGIVPTFSSSSSVDESFRMSEKWMETETQ